MKWEDDLVEQVLAEHKMIARKQGWNCRKHMLGRLNGILRFDNLSPGESYGLARAIKLLRGRRRGI